MISPARRLRCACPGPVHGGLGAGSHQDGEIGSQIVRFAAGQHERHGQHWVGHADRPAPAKFRIPEEPHQPGDPDRREVPRDQDELLRQDQPPGRRRSRSAGRDRTGHGQFGPPAAALPGQVGRPQPECDAAASIKPARPQRRPRPGHGQRGDDRGDQEGDQVGIEQPGARRQPGRQPEPLFASTQDPYQQPQQQRPDREIKGGRAEQVAGAGDHRCQRNDGTGQRLGCAPAAKLAGEQTGQQHQRPARQRDGSRSSTSDPGARAVISLATRGTNGG